MISTGKTEEFAIQCEVTSTSEGWIFGRFRFVFRNQTCGNWDDEADLKGILSWLQEFSNISDLREEPRLISLPSDDIFELLIAPVLWRGEQEKQGTTLPELFEDIYSRFHISHLGMSAFDRVTMILIENEELQRCLWNEGDSRRMNDYYYPSGTMQTVAAQFCHELERELSSIK